MGRAAGISLPAEKVEARLARARTSPPMVMPSMAVDLIAGNRLEYPWLGGRVQGAWKGTRRPDAGERFHFGRVEAVRVRSGSSGIRPLIHCFEIR